MSRASRRHHRQVAHERGFLHPRSRDCPLAGQYERPHDQPQPASRAGMAPRRFSVRWDGDVKFRTGLIAVAPALGLAWFAATAVVDHLLFALIAGPPALLLFLLWLWRVQGYELDAEGLHVLRPIGRLRMLREVTRLVDAYPAEFLLFRTIALANLGFCCFSGWFRERGEGWRRLWLTDLGNAVLLEGDRGSVLVSPAEREEFVRAVCEHFGLEPQESLA